MPQRPRPPDYPFTLSRTSPFFTVLLSDLNGPSRRQRLVLRSPVMPDWLQAHATWISPEHQLIVASMGKARLGAKTSIREIVVYPAQRDTPETAYVYVEEHAPSGRTAREAAPVHVVRCAHLPRLVRFVEVTSRPATPRPQLKLA